MSAETLKKKLGNLKGKYIFDFQNEEDCQYLFEQYGGEEKMRRDFPQSYHAFLKAKEDMAVRAEPQKEGKTDVFSGEIGKLTIERSKHVKDGAEGSGETGRLKTRLSCFFVDGTKKVCEGKPAETWKGISVQAKIKEANSPKYLLRKNFVVESTNQYDKEIYTGEDYVSEFSDKRYHVLFEVTGKDPSGKMNKMCIGDEFCLGEGESFNIYNVVVEDPAPKNDVHDKSNEIVMLYGRVNEQTIYKDADYKGGDYYDNTFSGGTVHLLMPIKGYMTLNYGIKPDGLYQPEEGEAFSRSTATYDYKQQIFTYRPDLNDENLYKSMKDCFTHGEYNPGIMTRVNFDLKIPMEGRSSLDWHSDIEGIQNGEPKTVMLDACFTYSVVNSLGAGGEEQITIKSKDKNFMETAGKKYYDFDKECNTVYIPPITIYWGCFAKDVLITMSDGSRKRACEIGIGDIILGYGNRELTVEDVVSGRDKTVFAIQTEGNGEIKVSGGHPMMCEGKMKRAAQIKPGDRLNLADGRLAKVAAVETVDYDDMVYNFTFDGEETGAYLIANGFYAGDLKMQNKREKAKEIPLTQEDQEFVEEMKRLQERMV